MTEIYLHFLFAHYGLYGNAPVNGAPLMNLLLCWVYRVKRWQAKAWDFGRGDLSEAVSRAFLLAS